MFPMRVYLYLFALFVPTLLHVHTSENMLYTSSISIVLYILVTQDGWKERLSAVFSNIVLVSFYRTFASLYFLVSSFFFLSVILGTFNRFKD